MSFEILVVAGSIVGGLGLFLLAIGMMTDGLKLAAGPSLRKILSDWTQTPLRGIFTGFGMTAIVQSSSAVTVASIGFVNAGLLNMRQALGIVYGANIGTTMTGWLVALVGFQLNFQAFALPLIGIGMLLKLVKTQGRLGSFGLALVGFGLFFIGIDILKSAFEDMVKTLDISQFTAEGLSGVATFMLIGILLTILTQSSSAAIALTITAASSGVMGTFAAAAMVIGANVGTTSTAVLATIGATSAAKRVAAAQVIFNVATALVALAILPILFFIIELLGRFIGLDAEPSITLALFHTIFNILGVLLIFPLNHRLASFLERRFLSWEEKEAHPRFLDKTIAMTPDLAVNALLLEMQAVAERVCAICTQAIKPKSENSHSFHEQSTVIKQLCAEISRFIVGVESARLSEITTQHLATFMRIEQYFITCTQLAERLAPQAIYRERFMVSDIERDRASYFQKLISFLQVGQAGAYGSEAQIESQFNEIQAQHDRLKARLLLAGTRSEIPVNLMSDTIDCIGEMNRMSQQWFKAIRNLAGMHAELKPSRINNSGSEVEIFP
jgi:phosphate:Na+ symporter